MKKLFLFAAFSALLPFALQAEEIFQNSSAFYVAKVVKLGRGDASATYFSGSLKDPSSSVGHAELLEECDDNCRENSCNRQNGVCSACKSGYYLKNNICLTCPENASCSNGVTFICNNSYYKASSSASSCSPICANVSCAAGTSPTASANSCCCY